MSPGANRDALRLCSGRPEPRRGTPPAPGAACPSAGLRAPRATSRGGHLRREVQVTQDARDHRGRRAMAEQFEETVRRRMPARVGVVALTAVSLILWTACATVAGLLLGRGEARRAEIAIRLALGAGRARVVRQLLVEGAVLALMAAAASTLLAYWIIRLVPTMVPAMPIAMNLDFQIDLRVLAFTLLVAMVAVPVFALAPALVASRPDLTPVLKGEPVRFGRWRWLTLRNALVVGQISLSLALLVSSGMLVRGLPASRAIDPGFRIGPMLFSTMAPQAIGYRDQRTRDFYERLLRRLRETPGVEAAALVRHLPLNSLFGGGARQGVVVPGLDRAPGEEPLQVKFNVVGLGYFDAMGTRILRGRDFAPGDGPGSQGVVLINETMAETYWGAATLWAHGSRWSPRRAPAATAPLSASCAMRST